MAVKQIGTIGDVNFVEHGGGPVLVDNGSASVEWVEPPEEDFDKPGATWTVYRTDLDQEIPSWIDMVAVARTSGRSYMELAAGFMDPDPMVRAFAYWDVANYYGWSELDHYPLVLGRADIGKRYGDDQYPLMPDVQEITQFTHNTNLRDEVYVNGKRLDHAVEPGISHFDIRVFADNNARGLFPNFYYVLSFVRKNVIGAAPKAFVRLTYFEDDDTQTMSPSAKLVLKGTKLDREFPDLDTVTPEEMLRRMSMWVPG